MTLCTKLKPTASGYFESIYNYYKLNLLRYHSSVNLVTNEQVPRRGTARRGAVRRLLYTEFLRSFLLRKAIINHLSVLCLANLLN